jgi:hypothetical protein
VKWWRYGLATAGTVVLLYGVTRLVIEVPGKLAGIALWLVGVVVLHDGILSPLVIGIGWLLARFVAPRGRRAVQAALIIAGMLTIIALPLIYRQGTHPTSKAWLLQNYAANLAVLLGLVAAFTLLAYTLVVIRDHKIQARGRTSVGDREGRPAR